MVKPSFGSSRCVANLDSSTRNEEPLVNRSIDLSRGQVLALGDLSSFLGANSVRRFLVGHIGQAETIWLSLALDQSLPRIAALSDNVLSIFLVLAFTAEGELVLWLSVWDLVDSEPFVGGSEEAREVSLHILDIVELRSKWIIDIDDDNLPISLFLVEKSHNTENLDLLDLTSVADKLADLADIKWVVIALSLGLGVNNVGVFPSLNMSVI